MGTARLVGALVVVLALAGSHWLAWSAGARGERARWLEQSEQAAAEAAERVRQVEQERFRAAEIAAVNHQAELDRARAAASGARGELRGLRRELAALDRAAGIAPGAASGADGSASAGTILGECAARYSRMAQTADELAARLAGLQAYVSGVLAAGQ
jgi:hypothetical protein